MASGPPLVQFALDGSVSHPEQIIAYAGVGADSRVWPMLSESWSEILERHGLRSFHMVEAMNFRGAFVDKGREWGSERELRRDALVKELAQAITQSQFHFVGWMAEIPLLASDSTRAEKKAEVFRLLVRQLLGLNFDNFQNPPSFALICDREQDLAKPVLGWVDRLCVESPEARERLAGVCFMNNRMVPPLQAADLCVYLFREEGERILERPDDPPNPLLMEVSGDRIRRHFIAKAEFTNPDVQALFKLSPLGMKP